MKLWNLTTFFTVSLLILSGCAVKPKPQKEAVVDETLPVVKITKNGTISDVNAIALEWQAITDQRVKGVYIYKAELNEDGGSEDKDEYYDTVNNRFITHYLDTKIKPNTKYNYYFKTYSKDAESLTSKATTISSLPMMESVAWIHSIQNMPRSAKILWRPHMNEKVKGYILQRRTLESEVWTDVDKIKGRLNAEYIDSGLKDQFTYIYRLKSITYDKLTSKPSKEVKVITKPLPFDVQNIRATTNLPKRIEVNWDRTKTKDFLTYRLYRSSSVDGSYEMLRELKENSYIDNIEEDGRQYFYRVSVVDKDELESIHDKSSIQGTTLVKPKTPSLVEAEIVEGKVKISWSKDDERAKTYIVQKRYKQSLFKELTEDFEGIKDLGFVDSEIEPDKTYSYTVFSVDVNNIKSEPSIEVTIKTEKLLSNEIKQNEVKQIDEIIIP